MENCLLSKPTIHFSSIPQYVLGAYWFTLGPEIGKWGHSIGLWRNGVVKILDLAVGS